MSLTMDLNSDLGESLGAWTMGDDASMLSIVSSANVACGFHAGDPAGILDTLKKAKANNVVVGAHVAYRDLVGFGRRNMDVAHADLVSDVIYQIGALQGLAAAAGTTVRYVKPHGALYNTIAQDRRQAAAVIEAMQAVGDRGYTPQGTLVSRREPGAVLHDPEMVAQRMLQLVQQGTVQANDGSVVEVQADSICVHGDSPGAVAMAKAVREHLQAAGVQIRSFMDKAGA